MVRHGLNTLPNTPVSFRTNWMPAPDIPPSSVQGIRHLGKFGTTSIPVPHTLVRSVRPPKMPRVPVRTYVYTYPFKNNNSRLSEHNGSGEMRCSTALLVESALRTGIIQQYSYVPGIIHDFKTPTYQKRIPGTRTSYIIYFVPYTWYIFRAKRVSN